jgi:hypothetical protein
MCDPVTIAAIGLGVSTASTGLGFLGSQQAAQSQTAANQSAADSARQSAILQHQTINTRVGQEREAASIASQSATRSQRAAQSRAFTAAGEGGVTGNSVNTLISDIGRSFGRDRTIIGRDLRNTENQLGLQARGVTAGAQSRINQLPRPNYPSVFGTGLQLIGGGASAYNNYRRNSSNPS